MNSLILSGLCSALAFVKKAFSNSFFGGLINKIYSAASRCLKKSRITGMLEAESDTDSVTFKICRLPFYFLAYISKLISGLLVSFSDKSIIAMMMRSFYNCFAGLNTRFFGAMAIGNGVMLISASAGKLSWMVLIIGLILSVKNINLSEYLKSSFFVELVRKMFDFEAVSFDFYKKESGILPVIIGAVTGALMGIVFNFSPFISIFIPFAVFGMIMVLRYPITGVFAAVFFAPIVPTLAVAGLCVFSFAALFLKKSRDGEHEWKTTGSGAFLILLLCLLFVSNLFSFSVVKSMLAWGMYFIFFSFYFVILNAVKTKEQLYGTLKIFVIAGLAVSLYGILQYIFKWNVQPNAWIDKEMFEDATMRAYSTLENPNVLGEYLLLLLPIAGVFMLDKQKASKWVYMGIFVLCAVCLVFTQSRGCWLGFILSAAIFVTFYKGKLWAALPLVLVILPFVLPQSIIDRMMSIGNMGDSSTSYRVYIWYGTVEMLAHYVVGGIGMGEGAFRTVYPFYGYDAIVAPHSHNLYLQLLTEGGIGALLFFAAVIIYFIKDSVRACGYSVKNSRDYLMSLAFSAGAAGFLLQSMFDYTFYNYRMMGMFIMYLAFCGVLKNLKEAERVEKSNRSIN